MTDLQSKLFSLRDEKYAKFQSKLTPNIPYERFIGVRVPILRKFAKKYYKDENHIVFLNTLPHYYYDENMLHGLLIEQIRSYDTLINQIEKFLPFVDNWAVCDIMSPKALGKNKEKLIIKINEWAKSEKTFTIRFGIEMLMSHFLDDDFKAEYLKIPALVKNEEYYVKMMVAWFFATALAKKWDATIPYIENHILDEWTHKKTIQKAVESFRITDFQKEYLKTLK